MAIRDEKLRDFVHTVDVLTASALVEHERARAPDAASAPLLLQRRYGAFAAVAGVVMAVCGGLYLAMPFLGPGSQHTRVQVSMSAPRSTEAARPASRASEASAPQRQAGLDLQGPPPPPPATPAAAPPPMSPSPAEAAQRSVAAEMRAAEDRAAEAKRLADAKKMADDERARREAEAKREDELVAARRVTDEQIAGDKRAADERARLAAAKAEYDRMAAEKRAADQRARDEAEAAPRKADEERRRVASVDPRETVAPIVSSNLNAPNLNAEERARLIRRVQEVLKAGRCYDGAVNGGNSDDAQEALDRFVETARRKGKGGPARIELAKAATADFDAWLRDADTVKDGLCAVPTRKPTARPREQQAREPSQPEPRRVQRQIPSYSGGGGVGGGGGGGGGGAVQGVR